MAKLKSNAMQNSCPARANISSSTKKLSKTAGKFSTAMQDELLNSKRKASSNKFLESALFKALIEAAPKESIRGSNHFSRQFPKLF